MPTKNSLRLTVLQIHLHTAHLIPTVFIITTATLQHISFNTPKFCKLNPNCSAKPHTSFPSTLLNLQHSIWILNSGDVTFVFTNAFSILRVPQKDKLHSDGILNLLRYFHLISLSQCQLTRSMPIELTKKNKTKLDPQAFISQLSPYVAFEERDVIQP